MDVKSEPASEVLEKGIDNAHNTEQDEAAMASVGKIQ